MKHTKQCCVRIPEELHRELKSVAYKHGWSMQDFLISIIKNELDQILLLERPRESNERKS